MMAVVAVSQTIPFASRFRHEDWHCGDVAQNVRAPAR
jgi:hypothetical protein